MKRNIIIAVAIGALVVGVSVLNKSAWNHGGSGMGGNDGMMSGGDTAYNIPVSQKHLDEARDIRGAIAADQLELNNLVARPNPDSTRVSENTKSQQTVNTIFQWLPTCWNKILN